MRDENKHAPKALTKAEEELLRALRLYGDLAPETPEEVLASKDVWEPVAEDELPDSLKNPELLANKIISDVSDYTVDIGLPPAQKETEEELARAARLGGTISGETAERMKQDKERTRRHVKNGSS